LSNCIVIGNQSPPGIGSNYIGSALNYCCTLPMPTNGVGNLASDPLLASLSHLSTDSPCIGAGSAAAASGTDLDGETWLNPPSIGCDEYHVGAATGALNVSIQADNANVGPSYVVHLTAQITG
jgi:hypothetical protein